MRGAFAGSCACVMKHAALRCAIGNRASSQRVPSGAARQRRANSCLVVYRLSVILLDRRGSLALVIGTAAGPVLEWSGRCLIEPAVMCRLVDGHDFAREEDARHMCLTMEPEASS